MRVLHCVSLAVPSVPLIPIMSVIAIATVAGMTPTTAIVIRPVDVMTVETGKSS